MANSRRFQGLAAAAIGASFLHHKIWRRKLNGGDAEASSDDESRDGTVDDNKKMLLAEHPVGNGIPTLSGVECSYFPPTQHHLGPSSILATSTVRNVNATPTPTPTHPLPSQPVVNSTNTKHSLGFQDADDYPNMKFNRSLLAKYLTRELWQELRTKQTKNGITLDYCIQSGVSLPLAYDLPRKMGIVAGDGECYDTFAPLLDEVIRDHHNFGDGGHPTGADSQRRIRSLRRHQTDINPLGITSHDPDPDGEYILSTRVRVCRNISGFPFPSYMSRSDRRNVERLFRASVKYLQPNSIYSPLFSMSNEDIEDLVQRHILFDYPDEWAVAAGLARDWPDARGIYLNVPDIDQTPDVVVHCNDEDHLSIICVRKDGDINRIFVTVAKCLRSIEASLLESGHEFVHHERLGYLTSCPTNIGTALRASVHVKLIRLGRLPGFKEMVQRLRLEAQGKHGETDKRYFGIFDISNVVRIGKSEVELINVMIHGVGKLIELEKALERGEEVDCSKLFLENEDNAPD